MVMSLFVISFCKASCSPFDMLELNGLYCISIMMKLKDKYNDETKRQSAIRVLRKSLS